MTPPIRVLLVDDSEDDAELVLHQLQGAGLDVVAERVCSAKELRRALAESEWDVVISDYAMPQFDGLKAATIVRSIDAELPFIFCSGALGAQRAVNAMRNGVRDYISKDNLDRLPGAVSRVARPRRMARASQPPPLPPASTRGGAIVDALRWPLVLVDRDLHMVGANPAFRSTFGSDYGPAVETLGDLIAHAPELRTRLTTVLEQGTEIVDLEIHIGLPGGGRRFLIDASRVPATDRTQEPLVLLVLRQ